MGTAKITEWEFGAGGGAGKRVDGGIELTVDFDPATLSLSYTPTGTADGAADSDNRVTNKAAPQQTGHSSSLTVELTFDTSTTGKPVQEKTELLVKFTKPNDKKRRVALFQWGTFMFYGTVTSLSQTINFFASDGTPLRAVVNLTLGAVEPPNPDDAGTSAGQPKAAFGAGASVGLGASIGAGASLSAGVGVSAGASLSAGVGVSASLSAAANFSASAGAGVGTTPLAQSRSGKTIATLTARAGGGADWKAVAAANGIDNPRMLAAGTVINPQARTEIG